MMISSQLRELIDHQEGLLTRRQLLDDGVTSAAVRRALARGEWRAVLPAVVDTRSGPLTERQRLVAARLHAGADSVIASLSAAYWHGVTAAADHRVHVVVPVTRHPRSAGFIVVRRSRRPDPHAWDRGPLVIASRARAVVDAARDAAGPGRATAIVCEAVERRLVTVEAVRNELEIGPRVGSRRVRIAVEEAEAGAWSVAEADLRSLVARSSTLPAPWLNPVVTTADGLRLPTPDAWFDDVGLAVQVHSWRWHSGREEWNSTVMSDGVFAEYGITVVAVTPQAITGQPDRVVERLERAYAVAARRPRPEVVVVAHDRRRSA